MLSGLIWRLHHEVHGGDASGSLAARQRSMSSPFRASDGWFIAAWGPENTRKKITSQVI